MQHELNRAPIHQPAIGISVLMHFLCHLLKYYDDGKIDNMKSMKRPLCRLPI